MTDSVIIDMGLQQTSSDETVTERNLRLYGTDGFTTEATTCLVELYCDELPMEFGLDHEEPVDPDYAYCTYTNPSHPHLQPMLVSAAQSPEESLALAHVSSLYLMHVDFDQSIDIDIKTLSVNIRDKAGRVIINNCGNYQRMRDIIINHIENS